VSLSPGLIVSRDHAREVVAAIRHTQITAIDMLWVF